MERHTVRFVDIVGLHNGNNGRSCERHSYDALMKKNLGTFYDEFWKVKKQVETYHYVSSDGMRKKMSEPKLATRDLPKEPLVVFMVYRSFGFNPKAPKKNTGSGFLKVTAIMRGRGLGSDHESKRSIMKSYKDDELEQKIDQFELKKVVKKQNEGNFGK